MRFLCQPQSPWNYSLGWVSEPNGTWMVQHLWVFVTRGVVLGLGNCQAKVPTSPKMPCTAHPINIIHENHNIAIAMSSSHADPMLGLNILQG